MDEKSVDATSCTALAKLRSLAKACTQAIKECLIWLALIAKTIETLKDYFLS